MSQTLGSPIRETRGVQDSTSKSDPPRSAPTTPSLTGPWNFESVVRHLETTEIPIRLATLSPRGPTVQSLWFEYRLGSIWCATQSDALVVRRLQRDPRCGFEVARDQPPYRGVRGLGIADILSEPGPEALERLLSRYQFSDTKLAAWLMSRSDGEVAIRITPKEITSWDFNRRMKSGKS
jgi:hypothetical protein